MAFDVDRQRVERVFDRGASRYDGERRVVERWLVPGLRD